MAKNNWVLRGYRKKHGLSHKVFAKKLRIAPSTLISLENGNKRITPERAKKIEERINHEISEGRLGEGLTRQQLLPEFFK